MLLAGVGVGVLYSLVVHIFVLIAAFKDGVGTGFLTLCLPFYALYFVFRVNNNNTLSMLFAVSLIIQIAFKFLIPMMR